MGTNAHEQTHQCDPSFLHTGKGYGPAGMGDILPYCLSCPGGSGYPNFEFLMEVYQ
jgi:hypothetical protein